MRIFVKTLIKIFLVAFAALALSACGSAKYYVYGEKASAVVGNGGMVLIERNAATRDGFSDCMQNWLAAHSYRFRVADGIADKADSPYLSYEGRWSWDLATYLRTAYISLYKDGRLMSRVRLQVPNNLNFSKFDSGEEKIDKMMSLLFFHECEGQNDVNVFRESADQRNVRRWDPAIDRD